MVQLFDNLHCRLLFTHIYGKVYLKLYVFLHRRNNDLIEHSANKQCIFSITAIQITQIDSNHANGNCVILGQHQGEGVRETHLRQS